MLNRLEQDKAYLVILAGPPSDELRLFNRPLADDPIPLSRKQPLLIGRNPHIVNLQIFGQSKRKSSISRFHCSIKYDPAHKGFLLRDEGSSNGTWIGEERLVPDEAHVLRDGDVITVGHLQHGGVRFLFTADADPPHDKPRKVLRPKEALPKTETVPQLSEADLRSAQQAETFVVPQDPEVTGKFQQKQIFISYSRKNTHWMRTIKTHIYDKGLAISSDEDLAPGTPTWHLEIGEMIKHSHALVVVLTPESATSQWVLKEVSHAVLHNVPILPLFLSGEDTIMPFILNTVQYVDLRDIPFDKVDLRQERHVQYLDKRIILPLYRLIGLDE